MKSNFVSKRRKENNFARIERMSARAHKNFENVCEKRLTKKTRDYFVLSEVIPTLHDFRKNGMKGD